MIGSTHIFSDVGQNVVLHNFTEIQARQIAHAYIVWIKTLE